MSVDRRTLLKTGAIAAAAAAFPAHLTGLTASAAEEAKTYYDYFSGLGYKAIKEADLITGDSFNGGIRYDEGHDFHADAPNGEPNRWYVFQDCARVEDIAKRNQLGVLAYFHIIGCTNNTPTFRGEVLEQVVRYLVGPANLKPERFVVVGTERGEPFLSQLEPFGIKREQVVFRQLEEARSAGDGSGYFKPDGNPMGQEFHTLSFHYAPEGSDIPSERVYPLPGYLEIGEFAFEPRHDVRKESEAFGLGVERLFMARGKSGSFERTRKLLLHKLKTEAKRREIPLPQAYHDFSEL